MPKFGYYGCILIAGILWGTTGFFNRALSDLGFSSSQVLFFRCVVPLVLLGVYCLVKDRNAFKIKLKDIWVFLGSGLLAFTTFGLAYMQAHVEMSLSVAVVLLYTSPIWVVGLSAILFKEKITLGKVAALITIALGAMLTTGVLTSGAIVTPTGLVLGLVSGLGYGLYSIFTRFGLNKGYKAITITFYTFLFSTIVVGCICDVPEAIELTFGAAALASVYETVFWQICIGVVTCLMPYAFYTFGLQGVENGRASILATIEMVVATLLGVVVFAEAFTVENGVGVALVFVGILLANITLTRRMKNRQSTSE